MNDMLYFLTGNNGNRDQNVNNNTRYRNDNELPEHCGQAEGEECENDGLDNILEGDENYVDVLEEETHQVMVGSLLDAVMNKSEEANKLKPAPFGRKKIKKKKKMETGLLKEILDFRPIGSRRHFSYH